MRDLMFVLSMIAAFAGTPLRLAEAAHDMADTMTEFGAEDSLRVPDGGVGDDSGATIKSDITHAPIETSCDEIAPDGNVRSAARFWLCLPCRADRFACSASSVPRRLAQLQCFLC